jgi:hypothetical protein
MPSTCWCRGGSCSIPGGPVNHLFMAGVPVLGALVALSLLRQWDRGILDAR